MWLFYDWIPWFCASILHLTSMQKLCYALMKDHISEMQPPGQNFNARSPAQILHVYGGNRGPMAVQTNITFHYMNSPSRKTFICFLRTSIHFFFMAMNGKWGINIKFSCSFEYWCVESKLQRCNLPLKNKKNVPTMLRMERNRLRHC